MSAMLFKCFMLCLAKCYCWLNYRALFILSALPLSERVSIQISQNLYLTFLWNHPLVVFQKKTLKFLQIKMPTRQKDSTASSFFGHRLLCAFFSLFSVVTGIAVMTFLWKISNLWLKLDNTQAFHYYCSHPPS